MRAGPSASAAFLRCCRRACRLLPLPLLVQALHARRLLLEQPLLMRTPQVRLLLLLLLGWGRRHETLRPRRSRTGVRALNPPVLLVLLLRLLVLLRRLHGPARYRRQRPAVEVAPLAGNVLRQLEQG